MYSKGEVVGKAIIILLMKNTQMEQNYWWKEYTMEKHVRGDTRANKNRNWNMALMETRVAS
jgi:hypothetical protein